MALHPEVGAAQLPVLLFVVSCFLLLLLQLKKYPIECIWLLVCGCETVLLMADCDTDILSFALMCPCAWSMSNKAWIKPIQNKCTTLDN
jgi:hypothetical protein